MLFWLKSRADGFFRRQSHGLTPKQFSELTELVEKLNKDRAWILEQLDKGSWPEFRPDLAALERELGQLLTRATEYIEENC